jgi:hypothetical protein
MTRRFVADLAIGATANKGEVPVQATPQATVEWQAIRLSGQDHLAVRASKKLRSEELLVTALAGTRLRMELDRVPLWRGIMSRSSSLPRTLHAISICRGSMIPMC